MRKHIHKGQIISRCRPAAAPLWATRIYQLKSLHCFALWEVTITIQNPSWLDKVQGIRPIIYTLWFQYLLELWRLCYEIKVKRARKIQLIMHRATSAAGIHLCRCIEVNAPTQLMHYTNLYLLRILLDICTKWIYFAIKSAQERYGAEMRQTIDSLGLFLLSFILV